MSAQEATKSDRALWAAVLSQAIKDLVEPFVKPRSETSKHGHKLVKDKNRGIRWRHKEVKDWLGSDDVKPGSFAWVCQQLDFSRYQIRGGIHGNPDKLRARMKANRITLARRLNAWGC